MTYLENEGSVSEHNEGNGGHCFPSQIKDASLSDQLAIIVVSIHDRMIIARSIRGPGLSDKTT